MPPAPKSKVPKHNERDIHPPLNTTVVEIAISGQKPQPIATGTTVSKKSWESVFQLLTAQGTGSSQNLNDSILEMIKDSHFLEAFFKNLLISRSNGSNKKLTDRDQALSIITAHRAVWDREILARGTSSSSRDETDSSDEVIAAGAIYAMFRMIPRAEDAAVAGYQLRWHKYYDSLPEVLLWAVLHDFLRFLRSHAVKKTTFGRTLLEICGVEAARIDGPNEDRDDDDTSDDKQDGEPRTGGELDDQDVPPSTAAFLSNDHRRDGSRLPDQQRGILAGSENTATGLHRLLVFLVAWLAVSSMLYYWILQERLPSYCASWFCEVGRICSFPAHLLKYLGSELLEVLLQSLLRVVQWAWMLRAEKQVPEPHI